jgi:hypothetical protein
MNAEPPDPDHYAKVRDEIRALRASWVWKVINDPYFERRAKTLIATALRPVPNDPAHEEARYRLAEIHAFQDFLNETEAVADDIAKGREIGQGIPDEEPPTPPNDGAL